MASNDSSSRRLTPPEKFHSSATQLEIGQKYSIPACSLAPPKQPACQSGIPKSIYQSSRYGAAAALSSPEPPSSTRSRSRKRSTKTPGSPVQQPRISDSPLK